jgi:ABC-type bacteriocin/lantibiotic exporter with double-glycine peptidase domain
MVFSTLVEGIGIALFLPLLKNGVSGDDRISKSTDLILKHFNLSYSTSLILILILSILFFRGLILVIQRWFSSWLVSGMKASIQSKILVGYFNADYNYYMSQKSGYMLNAVARELPGVAAAYSMFTSILSSMVIASVYLSIPLILHPKSTLYVAAFGVVMYFSMTYVNKLLKSSSIEYSSVSANLQNYVIQSLNFYKYLKSTNTFSPILKKIQLNIEKTRQIQLFQDTLLQALPHHCMEFLAFTTVIGLIYYQVVIEKQNIETMLFTMFLLYRSTSVLIALQMQHRKLLSYSGSINVYNHLKLGIDNYKETINESSVPVDLSKDITLNNVSFKYNGAKNSTLENIDMLIKANTTIGIAGESGSGKTTLMSLLTGVIKPDSGEIKIGKHKYSEHNVLNLRSKIGYVTQENTIFNENIINNISLWDENLDKDKVVHCSKMALAYDFILEQPSSFEEQLGDNGINMSGGQRQRIIIARELYKNSEILIFDEATSALDSESEKEIQNSINKLKGNKTIIIIAHRLFTLKQCDLIYLFKKGKVIAAGGFDELLNSSDEFNQMCSTQNLDNYKNNKRN